MHAALGNNYDERGLINGFLSVNNSQILNLSTFIYTNTLLTHGDNFGDKNSIGN